MVGPEEFIELTNRLQDLFQERDTSYTLCVVIGEMECELLRFIHKIKKPMKMKVIAETFHISNAKVTRVFNKLEDMGLIQRFPSEVDRRSWYALITEEGKKMAENTKYKLIQLQEAVLKKIPKNDIEKIYEYMKIFVDAYSETIKEFDKPILEKLY
ncbi:MAG TPA: MarR family transcriptional regulator [Candidatus Cloacimonetes bacterium]|nr:MarR family transcriptional regulator [Candidatus Cloacimonadota bacterium]